GPPHGDRLRGRVADESVIWNAHPERGMLSSLQLGAAAALRAEASHLMVALVDHPHVRIETLRALLEACKGSGSSLVRPRYRGRRGHPWIADAALLRRILALSLDVPEGVRTAFRGLDSELELELDDPAILEDLDTLEELRRAGFEPEVPGGGFP
ncbi:MAG: NTP transferase domain-containing protein, partial [Myxococcales bacterium]|nr:NTP transferase domain-containing protein [Myxococcales bacterium]